MNARQTRLFHRTYALTRSLSAAFRAASRTADCGLRCCRQRRSAACRAAPAHSADAPTSGEAADLERAVAALESEAVRRALSGVPVPVFHQGRECGSTVKHSDQLLMFLLKTLRPERYAGGKEPAAHARAVPDRIFALEIDLSAAGEEAAGMEPKGDGREDEADEAVEGES